MERISTGKTFCFRFRNRTFRFGFGFNYSDDEPTIPKLEGYTNTKPDAQAALIEKISEYHLVHSGRLLLIKTIHGIRIEIDPYSRVVKIDGRPDWVGVNFGGLEYGWEPDKVDFHWPDEKPEPVEWTMEYAKDKFENLNVRLTLGDDTLTVGVNSAKRYVMVWDAAIKALLNGRYYTVGPDRQLPSAFQQMKETRRFKPKIVQFEKSRSA